MLSSDLDFDSSFASSSILRATCEEASHDEIVHSLVIALKVVDVRSGMNRRMRFIVLLAVSRSFEPIRIE